MKGTQGGVRKGMRKQERERSSDGIWMRSGTAHLKHMWSAVIYSVVMQEWVMSNSFA